MEIRRLRQVNLLLVNYEYPPVGGGAANASRYLAKGFLELGHGATVLTSSFRGLAGLRNEEGVRVCRVPSIRRKACQSNMAEMAAFLLSAFLHARGIAREGKIDGSIAFFTLPSGLVGWELKKALGIPYVISLRGGDVPGHVPGMALAHCVTAPARRMVLSEARAIAANSSSLAELSRKSDPYDVTVIPNGVDTDYFRPGPGKNGVFRILFVGRLHAEKNLPFIIGQLDRLSREIPLPFELHLAGDGPDRENVLSSMNGTAIRHRIFLHGWCDQETVRSLYGQADCVVNPSLYEGLSNSCLEAMACGLPVVASRVSGNSDLITHDDTGFLFDLHDPEQFRDAVRRLMESRETGRATGLRARSFVERNYSWKAAARRYIETFTGS